MCDEAGGLYALSNKLPPFGYPTSFATVGKGFILDPVTQSCRRLTACTLPPASCPVPPVVERRVPQSLSVQTSNLCSSP